MRLARLAVGVPLAGLVWSAQRAQTRRVSALEDRVFRACNHAPAGLAPLVWPVTQMGALGALLGAAATGASRMYVGAHLPLDIVGGAAAGWLVGATAAACGASFVHRADLGTKPPARPLADERWSLTRTARRCEGVAD